MTTECFPLCQLSNIVKIVYTFSAESQIKHPVHSDLKLSRKVNTGGRFGVINFTTERYLVHFCGKKKHFHGRLLKAYLSIIYAPADGMHLFSFFVIMWGWIERLYFCLENRPYPPYRQIVQNFTVVIAWKEMIKWSIAQLFLIQRQSTICQN